MVETQKSQRFDALHLHYHNLCLTKLVGVFSCENQVAENKSMWENWMCGSAVYIRVKAPRNTNLEAETPN